LGPESLRLPHIVPKRTSASAVFLVKFEFEVVRQQLDDNLSSSTWLPRRKFPSCNQDIRILRATACACIEQPLTVHSTTVPTQNDILIPETLLKKRKSQERAREERAIATREKRGTIHSCDMDNDDERLR
jgi:hypothetical protein